MQYLEDLKIFAGNNKCYVIYVDSKRLSERAIYRRYVETEVVDIVNGKKIKKKIRKSSGPGSVTIIPMVSSNKVLLVRQYRPALRKPGNKKNNGWIYELPGGHTEEGESIYDAAKRELEEELGYTAKKLKFLYNRHFTPWSSDALDNLFVASGLEKGTKQLDDDELITTVTFSANEVARMLKNGSIKDVSTRDGLSYWLILI